MSKLNITYYKQLNDIKITESNISDNYCDIDFNITDRSVEADTKMSFDCNREIKIQNLSVVITEKDNKFPEIIYPEKDCTFISTDQFFVFSKRINWKVDDKLNITVKVGKLEKTFDYTVPKPKQPYKSWTWENNQWNSPTKYPDDENEYIWNEEKLNWELE
jgi:hypothetical protein